METHVPLQTKKKDKNTPKEDNSGKFGRMTKLCLLSEELQSIMGARFMKRCDVSSAEPSSANFTYAKQIFRSWQRCGSIFVPIICLIQKISAFSS